MLQHPPITSSNKTDWSGTAFFTFHQNAWWGLYWDTCASREPIVQEVAYRVSVFHVDAPCIKRAKLVLGVKKAWAAIQTVLVAILRIPNRLGNGIKRLSLRYKCFELYERRKGEIEKGGKRPHSLATEWSFVEEGQTLVDFGKEFWIAPPSVFVLSRKVCPCRSRFRFSLFFCPRLLFCWEAGKYWDVHGLDKDFSALAMAECRNLLVVKMRKRQAGMWDIRRQLNRIFVQSNHFFNRIRFSLFWRRERVPDFPDERSGVAVKW